MVLGYKDSFDQKYYVPCSHFHRCPICYKCMGPVGAFAKCDRCIASDCHHTEKQREMMIKRKNFAITIPVGLDPDIDEAFQNMFKKADEIISRDHEKSS